MKAKDYKSITELLEKKYRLLAKYNLDDKYPQYFGEDKNYQDKYFINETDNDVYKWCENENETPIRFNKNGEIKIESEV
tara:strand:- start:29 stop:265 length:237 start_codon:yes stop_codon:yes gene_type:complete